MATIHFTDENFEQEVLKSDIPVLVDFYAEWCGPCKMMAPIIEELSEEYAGKWKVGKVNVDDCPTLSATYGIQSIPSVFFFKNGEIVDKTLGFKSKDDLVGRMA